MSLALDIRCLRLSDIHCEGSFPRPEHDPLLHSSSGNEMAVDTDNFVGRIFFNQLHDCLSFWFGSWSWTGVVTHPGGRELPGAGEVAIQINTPGIHPRA